MGKQTLTVEARLAKANISVTFYKDSYNELNKLGYSEDQINRIVIRKFSSNTVVKLLELHSLLNINFDYTQLTKLAAHKGGAII